MYPWDGKNVYFIGFMGTGKSRVGKAFADLLGWPFADTDALIEDETGLRVSEIFSQSGEPAFRTLENEMVERICGKKQWVISLGGGAVMRDENWRKIQNSGLTICLNADSAVLFKRLARKGQRPLLDGLTDDALYERIVSLLKMREPIYQQAHYHFESREEVSARDLAEKIFLYLQDEP
jgi:shikimate kinase